jgi:hypothetical protein
LQIQAISPYAIESGSEICYILFANRHSIGSLPLAERMMRTERTLVVRYVSPFGDPRNLSQGQDFQVLKREPTAIDISFRGGYVRGPARLFGQLTIQNPASFERSPAYLKRIAYLAVHGGFNKCLFHNHATALYDALAPFRSEIYRKHRLDTFYWPRNLLLAAPLNTHGIICGDVTAYLNFYQDPHTIVYGKQENVLHDKEHFQVIPITASFFELMGRYQEEIYRWWLRE